MYCPNCRFEYREGYTQCKNCHVALVDELPPVDEESLTPKRQLPWMKYLRIEYIPILCALASLVFLVLVNIQSISTMFSSANMLPHSSRWLLLTNLTLLPSTFLYVFTILVFLYRLLGKEFGHKRLFYQICVIAYFALIVYTIVILVTLIQLLISVAPHTFYSEGTRSIYIKQIVNNGLTFGSQLALIFFFIGRLRGWTKSLNVWTIIYLAFTVTALYFVDWFIGNNYNFRLLFIIASDIAVAFLLFMDRGALDKRSKVKQEMREIQYSPEK